MAWICFSLIGNVSLYFLLTLLTYQLRTSHHEITRQCHSGLNTNSFYICAAAGRATTANRWQWQQWNQAWDRLIGQSSILITSVAINQSIKFSLFCVLALSKPVLVLIGRFAAVVSVHLYNSDFDGGDLIPGTALFIYVNDWGLVLLMSRNKVCDYKILKASCIIRVTHSKYHYSLTTKLILLSSTCYIYIHQYTVSAANS